MFFLSQQAAPAPARKPDQVGAPQPAATDRSRIRRAGLAADLTGSRQVGKVSQVAPTKASRPERERVMFENSTVCHAINDCRCVVLFVRIDACLWVGVGVWFSASQ
jgi:hypothetical protein